MFGSSDALNGEEGIGGGILEGVATESCSSGEAVAAFSIFVLPLQDVLRSRVMPQGVENHKFKIYLN